MGYRYYSTQRPIAPGAYPKPEKHAVLGNEVLEIVNFDNKEYVEEIDRNAWGYIEYEKPLGHFDVINYELVAVKTKTLHLRYLGKDSWGRYVYQDENGKLWKNTDCCSPRECCEERGDTLNSAAGNSFDGEPDCFMGAHIQVEYIEVENREKALIQNLVEEIRASGDYLYNEEFVKHLEEKTGITRGELVSYCIFEPTILERGE